MTKPQSIIRAFSADHVTRLTGLSKGQLRYWDKTGFFQPRYAYEDRSAPYSRVYSFRDIVGLRTLAVLRKEHKVSLQHLRDVAQQLDQELDHFNQDLWATTTLYVLKKKVHFREPTTAQIRRVLNGQYVMIRLVRIINDVSEGISRLKERSTEQVGKIERHRHVARNAWVHAGTRIPTEIIASFKEAGYTNEQIRREYPSLTDADIEAAVEKHEELQAKRA